MLKIQLDGKRLKYWRLEKKVVQTNQAWGNKDLNRRIDIVNEIKEEYEKQYKEENVHMCTNSCGFSISRKILHDTISSACLSLFTFTDDSYTINTVCGFLCCCLVFLIIF